MAILISLQHSSYAYPSTAAAVDFFFPVSVHRPNLSRSSPRYCQLSDHKTPPLSPLPRSRIARTDKSLLNVSESFSEAELWAAANLRVRIFYQFNEQTFGIEVSAHFLFVFSCFPSKRFMSCSCRLCSCKKDCNVK